MNDTLRVIIVSVFALVSAQTIKFIAYSIIAKKIQLKMLISTGGMPSSHSALVTSLFIALLLLTIEKGNWDKAFYLPMSLVLALVVIHDSMGIRYEASKHATILNYMVKDFEERQKEEIGYKKELKEFLGHKPIEAICGVIFGIIIGFLGYYLLGLFV